MSSAQLDTIVSNPYGKDTSYVFQSELKYKEQVFKGFLAIKYLDENNFHLSLMSGLGNTMMELEWKDGEFIKHYVPEELDKRIIMKKMRSDFEFLFLQRLYSTKPYKGRSYYFETNSLDFPDIIYEAGRFGKKKRELNFNYAENGGLNGVELKHYNLAASITLSILSEWVHY